MGGFFGVVSQTDCVADLFYGTDYHSHLGTMRGGLAVRNEHGTARFIHDITNAQFRSKFESDLPKLHGHSGIGVISDFEDQPLIIHSHLGPYAIVTVGVVRNADDLLRKAFGKRHTHFSEMSGGRVNPTELVATIINEGATFEEGIRNAQETIEGSCSILLLTDHGIYAARDRLGRTPVIIGQKPGSHAATVETCAFPNLDYTVTRYLGPGEIVLITPDGCEQKRPPGDRMQICTFLWVYYGYPASSYEGINVEATRNRCGAALARNDTVQIDLVAGIPDSGIAHAIGYANQAKKPYQRPFVKYTPTWPRSFMPQDQTMRDLVARMKLIPVTELIQGKRLLFCEDSIVRGTQLKDTIQRLYDSGALEVHMRPACPPLVYGCKFLNFSRSRSELDLAARRAIRELEGSDDAHPSADASPSDHAHLSGDAHLSDHAHLSDYATEGSDKYCAMVDRIRQRLGLTTLQYQRLPDLVEAVGLPKSKLCTYCWDGAE